MAAGPTHKKEGGKRRNKNAKSPALWAVGDLGRCTPSEGDIDDDDDDGAIDVDDEAALDDVVRRCRPAS